MSVWKLSTLKATPMWRASSALSCRSSLELKPSTRENAGTGSVVRRRAAARRLPLRVLVGADRERQQAIAHRLRGLVALGDQLVAAPPVERSELGERHVDDDVGLP